MDNHISGGIFFGAVVQGRRVKITLPRVITPSLQGLPRRGQLFSGRSDELAEVVQELQRVPVTSIVGMPGVGKTALAVEAAWRAWKDKGLFSGGVLFVELHGYDDHHRVSTHQALVQLLHALSIPDEHISKDPKSEQELTRLYRSVLAAYAEQERRLLVVVDDASDDDQVGPLLPNDDYHGALVTSRHKLVLSGTRLHLRPLDTDSAVELIRRVLQEIKPVDRRVDGDRASAERIADLCGYLPLALWISAALLADISDRPLAEFAAQLAEAHQRLNALARDERTVRAAFDLSYQRLDREQARLFGLLALNPGPDISTEAAGQLAGTRADRTLESLARAHLIEAPRWGRWAFHDLVRLFAEERAVNAPAGELSEARNRLNSYYVETALAAALNLNDTVATSNDGPFTRFLGAPDRGIAWLDDEYLNLLAAAVRANADRHAGLSLILPVALGGYLRLRRVLPQWTELLERAVRAGKSLGEVDTTGIALDLLALALQQEGRLEKAAVAARRAVKSLRKAREKFRENAALSHLAAILADQGQYEEAARILRNTVDRLKEEGGGGMTNRAHALKDLGEVLLRLGRYEEAEKFSAEAADCFDRVVRDEVSEAEALLCRGSAMFTLGNPAAPLYLHRASEHFRKHGNLVGLAATLNVYGCATWSFGHHDQAVEILCEAADCAAEAGNDAIRAQVVDNLVSAYTALGRPEQAARLALVHGARALTAEPRPPTPRAPDGGRRWRFGWLSRHR
ncbi:tetratricopeptide repeat protein [Kitasatospora sp. NPDC004745]|uniref:tetratricopeptide repeat protein n=1 Tax=Kitasatospora sp. NPDC004745 TaxID=3364019 RepID=UPI00368E52D0